MLHPPSLLCVFCVQSSKNVTFFFICCVLHLIHPLCFLCIKLQACNIFFYCMLHPAPSFMFLVSTTLNAQCYFVLLHFAPLTPPSSLFFCVHSSKCVTLFLLHVPPAPLSSMCFVSKTPNVQRVFFCCVLHPPPFHYVFCVQTSKHTISFFFSIVCCTCPLCFVFFCVQTSNV